MPVCMNVVTEPEEAAVFVPVLGRRALFHEVLRVCQTRWRPMPAMMLTE